METAKYINVEDVYKVIDDVLKNRDKQLIIAGTGRGKTTAVIKSLTKLIEERRVTTVIYITHFRLLKEKFFEEFKYDLPGLVHILEGKYFKRLKRAKNSLKGIFFATFEGLKHHPDLVERADLVIIDETHLFTEKSYRPVYWDITQLVGDKPILGLTATELLNESIVLSFYDKVHKLEEQSKVQINEFKFIQFNTKNPVQLPSGIFTLINLKSLKDYDNVVVYANNKNLLYNLRYFFKNFGYDVITITSDVTQSIELDAELNRPYNYSYHFLKDKLPDKGVAILHTRALSVGANIRSLKGKLLFISCIEGTTTISDIIQAVSRYREAQIDILVGFNVVSKKRFVDNFENVKEFKGELLPEFNINDKAKEYIKNKLGIIPTIEKVDKVLPFQNMEEGSKILKYIRAENVVQQSKLLIAYLNDLMDGKTPILREDRELKGIPIYNKILIEFSKIVQYWKNEAFILMDDDVYNAIFMIFLEALEELGYAKFIEEVEEEDGALIKKYDVEEWFVDAWKQFINPNKWRSKTGVERWYYVKGGKVRIQILEQRDCWENYEDMVVYTPDGLDIDEEKTLSKLYNYMFPASKELDILELNPSEQQYFPVSEDKRPLLSGWTDKSNCMDYFTAQRKGTYVATNVAWTDYTIIDIDTKNMSKEEIEEVEKFINWIIDNHLNVYVRRTKSGGYHIIGKGKLPEQHKAAVEIFSTSNRVFILGYQPIYEPMRMEEDDLKLVYDQLQYYNFATVKQSKIEEVLEGLCKEEGKEEEYVKDVKEVEDKDVLDAIEKTNEFISKKFIDIEEPIKRQDLIMELLKQFGEPVKVSQKDSSTHILYYNCPYHKPDKHPSFTVYVNTSTAVLIDWHTNEMQVIKLLQ